MIKQDYLIRMIQEIITLVVNAILNKKRIQQKEWKEYDAMAEQVLGLSSKELLNIDIQELIEKYKEETDRTDKIELAGINMLRLSEEIEDNILLKSRLRQDGLQLLKYVQKEADAYSLQREYLIKLLETNN
ncbi:hypothetical protein [Bacteroides heparinolyticus]|uniref:Uncharacterized protein n=2 Tax=Prevotella heparinolytica TaxID=28113 RepID=A0A449I3I3_9BACE|nr:hypothetical protein [Bacteroides heparinolyticus]MCF0254834.1 hypothetical protein [Bacteroides heparinolyticus]TCO95273.1 hypothetical protein EV202_103153 [Bacteroides heparinolyticus]VFB14043.1 Uncharacterised protein [Bacteroides heparinolyticus]